uniref:Uncharacterized protein n=1 Tax=Kalanchoe fedtschenkoi TaxID=63787 RepID=A0A7N0VLX0_KALFE
MAHPVSETTAPSIATSVPTVSTQAAAFSTQTAVSSAISTPQSTGGIVPQEQLRELFKWILDERRKLKPKDAAEKKRIDAEKAVLKQFIRAQSVPSI